MKALRVFWYVSGSGPERESYLSHDGTRRIPKLSDRGVTGNQSPALNHFVSIFQV